MISPADPRRSRTVTAAPADALNVSDELRQPARCKAVLQKAVRHTSGRVLRAVSSFAPAMALVIFLVVAVRAGLSTADAVAGVLAILITQILPGALLWRLVRPARGWWIEDIVVGFALGICVAVGSQAVAGSLQIPWFAGAAGPTIAAMLLASPTTRTRIMAATTQPLPLGWAPAVAAVTAFNMLPAVAFFRSTSLAWPEGFRSVYLDMPFHLALAAQLAHRGPGEVPFVTGEPLRYHWFSHAWIAQTSLSGGVPLDALLFRFMPAVMSVLVVLAVACAAVRISGRVWTGPLAALLATAGGDLDVFGATRPGSLVNHLSPSLSLSMPVVMIILTLLVCRWRGTARAGSGVMLVLLAVTAAGIKGSALPVVVAGASFAAAAAWVFRLPERWSLLRDVLLLVGGFVIVMGLVFRGASQGLLLKPSEAAVALGVSGDIHRLAGAAGKPTLLLLALLLLVSLVARGSGMLGLLSREGAHRDPAAWLLLGTGLSGAAAVLLFTHTGKSQMYFLRNAAPAFAIGSALGIAVLADALARRKLVTLAAAALAGAVGAFLPPLLFGELRAAGTDALTVAVTSGLCFLLFVGTVAALLTHLGTTSPSRRTRIAAGLGGVSLCAASIAPVAVNQLAGKLPAYAHDVGSKASFAISADQVEAARWIRDHSRPDDIVMTNRHCSHPTWASCDSRRFHVAAYTERRVLVEGWAYTESWIRTAEVSQGPAFKPFWDQELLELNDQFLRAPDAATAERLGDAGVRWLFIDKTVAYSTRLKALAAPRLETQWAWVLELRAAPLAAA
jgi:hypothetical protein